MRLAFYAPMKPPTHPTPSGDRTLARGLMTALEGLGTKVTLASTLRSRDGKGELATQDRLMAKAEAEITRLIPQGRAARWRAWISYHNYYKAPDLIGPAVTAALNIPYLQVESTRAAKRLTGPWARFAQAAEAAADAAQVVFSFTARDAQSLRTHAPQGQHLIHLHPFLTRECLPDAAALNGPMLSVGMMRPGDKLASYTLIAEALRQVPAPWELHIAGDGTARTQVERLMAPLPGRVHFLGLRDAQALEKTYQGAALLLWPGVNEAFGLTYLEAQAAGLPIVAQNRPGMNEVLAPGIYPNPDQGAEALADQITHLLHNPLARHAAGKTARAHVAAHHLLPAARATLAQGLAQVGLRS